MPARRNRLASEALDRPEDPSEYWASDVRLRPPHYRVRLLDRARLMTRLDEVLEKTLTVVRTPAGYGKTTLLSQWCERLEQRSVAAIWIGLEEDDRDAAQFVSYLAWATSVRGINSQPLLRALHRGTPAMSPEELVRSLLHEFHKLEAPIVLLFDDYHLIEGPRNDQLVSLLIRRAPPNLHLVLASRTKPAFPLSELRTTGKLQELDAQELRFSAEETMKFLGGLMQPRDVALLAERTEGWPVALQLACLLAGGQGDAQAVIAGFSGSSEEMAAYLVDRVMLALPETTREFLIQTSILERINGDLANAVCGRQDCWGLLAELERLNALIFPLDSARTWYRHHQLFADFLRAQLQRRGEEEIRALHRRASRWFLDKDQVFEAVKYACRAGDQVHALSLLDQAGLFYRMLRDGAAVYKRLTTLLPRHLIETYPRVAIAHVLLLIKEGELQEGRILLEEIQRKLAAGRYAASEADRHELAQEILVMDCFLRYYLDAGVKREAIAAMEAFAGSIDPDDHWYRAVLNNLLCTMHRQHGNLINAMATAHASMENFTHAGLDYGVFFIHLHLGNLRLLHGELAGSVDSFREARRIVDDSFPYDSNMRALSQIFLAEVCYERNRLDEAGEYIFDALRQVEAAEGWIEVYLSAYRTALGLAFASRALKGVEPIVEMGRKFARRRKLMRLEWFLEMRRAMYLALSGDAAAARVLVDRGESLLERMRDSFDEAEIWREREEYLCTLARLLIQEGSPARALEVLQPLAQKCESTEHVLRLIQVLLLLGIACRALQDLDQAAQHLRRALHYTRSEGMLRIFLDEGRQAEELLKAVLAHVGVSAISDATLDWVADILSAFAASGPDSDGSLINSVLTQRERDVLSQLRGGASNKGIARKLDITDNAVKFHLKNIYRKLGVKDRRLAISIAERRGLLADPVGQV